MILSWEDWICSQYMINQQLNSCIHNSFIPCSYFMESKHRVILHLGDILLAGHTNMINIQHLPYYQPLLVENTCQATKLSLPSTSHSCSCSCPTPVTSATAWRSGQLLFYSQEQELFYQPLCHQASLYSYINSVNSAMLPLQVWGLTIESDIVVGMTIIIVGFPLIIQGQNWHTVWNYSMFLYPSSVLGQTIALSPTAYLFHSFPLRSFWGIFGAQPFPRVVKNQQRHPEPSIFFWITVRGPSGQMRSGLLWGTEHGFWTMQHTVLPESSISPSGWPAVHILVKIQ